MIDRVRFASGRFSAFIGANDFCNELLQRTAEMSDLQVNIDLLVTQGRKVSSESDILLSLLRERFHDII